MHFERLISTYAVLTLCGWSHPGTTAVVWDNWHSTVPLLFTQL